MKLEKPKGSMLPEKVESWKRLPYEGYAYLDVHIHTLNTTYGYV